MPTNDAFRCCIITAAQRSVSTKFPRLSDYVVPAVARIANALRVRIAALLSSGTAVAGDGVVNFNTGMRGAETVEGRQQQGVSFGEGLTVGRGTSIMGTLSNVDSALQGAISGFGISIVEDSDVEAGPCDTVCTKVWIPANETFIKASNLSGAPKLLFRGNFSTEAVDVLPAAEDALLIVVISYNDSSGTHYII